MSDSANDLNRMPDTGHLVVVRVFDEADQLVRVWANEGAIVDSLRVLHGVGDRDGRIGPEERKKALELLNGLRKDKNDPVVSLLEGHEGALRLKAVASPLPGLLERICKREGSLADTEAVLDLLNAGDIRAAEKVGGVWQPQPYVIDGILNFFKVSENRLFEGGWWDKIPLKTVNYTESDFTREGVRYAPGAQIRTGSYVGPGTVIMNQAFVNIGAYIAGEGVMIDGASRVASCAQVGKGVKFGAGSGIEGVLEPAGRLPSIIEDGVSIGAMCEVSGIIEEGSVLASGVAMASGKKIFDEGTGEVVPPLPLTVGEKTFQLPVIPPYRLAVGGSMISSNGKTATDAIILKAGDLRDRGTQKHFEKQGILYT